MPPLHTREEAVKTINDDAASQKQNVATVHSVIHTTMPSSEILADDAVEHLEVKKVRIVRTEPAVAILSLFIEVFLLFVSGLLPVVVLSYGAYSRSDVMVISLGRN